MENIFKNAYFGKAYKTRDGRKAIFVSKYGAFNNRVVYENNTRYVGNNGRIYANVLDKNDIVSEWQEEINEQELNMLAEEYASTQKTFEEAVIAEKAYETGYKDGYRKAKES